MTTVSHAAIDVSSRQVMPPGSRLVLTARLQVTTDRPEGTVNLTGQLHQLVAEARVIEGTVHVYCGHTTCGLLVNELDTGLETDTSKALERLLPHSSRHPYSHDKDRTAEERALHGHGERDNGHAHLRAVMATHPELHVPVTDGALYLGRWQAVMLAEHDGPRTRELLVRINNDLTHTA
ncbi:secondary thiamine-phosphate synthase enzyme YjbQ [Streptomyces sp. NPDC052101]|uniref:secondary thiamine-phosphate synthase enzyme YjbQ n=1 Tax=Streptomyces sp. NPDC052101 TaxID=3155763 RepID=UPI00342378DF